MIKAEIISHEGNPGPNWLDRCRNLVTPASISTVIVFVAAAALIIGITQNRANDAEKTKASSTSQQQSNVAQPLSVQSSTAATYPTADGTATVQAATGSGNIGAPATNTNGSTPLNSTATTPDVSRQSNYSQQSSLNGRTLTKGVQSTVPSAGKSLKHMKQFKKRFNF